MAKENKRRKICRRLFAFVLSQVSITFEWQEKTSTNADFDSAVYDHFDLEISVRQTEHNLKLINYYYLSILKLSRRLHSDLKLQYM